MSYNLLTLRCIHYAATVLFFKGMAIVSPEFIFYYFSNIANFILYALLAVFSYEMCKHWYKSEVIRPDGKAVLITGCDSGFGNMLAKRLDSKGFHVFASCLFPEEGGAKSLKQSCSDRLQVLHLDVTKDESVEKAKSFIEQNLENKVLWAVVNNAGLSKGFSTDFSSIDDFKDSLNVNTLGPIRVTKAVLPLLKKSRGRVINVASYVARCPIVESCAYRVSKSAVLAFTENLSIEMKVWGVRVISIEPDGFKTGLLDPDSVGKRMDATVSKVSKDIFTSYGQEYVDNLKKVMTVLLNIACSNVSLVVDCMEEAITKKYPEYVYTPCRNMFVRALYYVLQCIPFELFETVLLLALRILNYPVPKYVKDKTFH